MLSVAPNNLTEIMAHTKAAHERLVHSLAELDDDSIRKPSRLPGWSRAHVLTHLARNADSHVRLLEAASEGRETEQYEGGSDGRAREIEEGATRPAPEILRDVESSAARLFETWAQVPDEVWSREVRAIHGRQPAWVCVWSRWRETEIHHVDLAWGYGPADWPEEFVDAVLEDVAGGLDRLVPEGPGVILEATDGTFATASRGADPDRACVVRGPRHGLLAWLIGRANPAEAGLDVTLRGRETPAPALRPWA